MALTVATRGTSLFIQVGIDHDRLFRASCFALVASALSFAIRGDILGELSVLFSLDKARLGWIAGAAFWGPTVSVLMGGQLCDFLGMRRLLQLAFLAHLTGTLLTIFAAGFWYLWAGTLSIGTANGLVEAAINPLVATVYAQQKTQKLNALHAWFPGGIVIGGLVAAGLTEIHFHWQAKMALILVPTFLYGWMFLKLKFPPTERVQQGISTAAMYSQALRPQFLIWIFSMLLTASTELGPNQWIPSILTNTAHLEGILVLVWINGLMAAGRMVAGPVVRRLSSLGLLTSASCFSAVGLFLLSLTSSPASAFLAATVFAVGICYFWPTMLGATSERFPAGGALLLGIIGAAGNLSVAMVLPIMGRIYDIKGPAMALRYIVALPLLLIGIFAVLWFKEPARSSLEFRQARGQTRSNENRGRSKRT